MYIHVLNVSGVEEILYGIAVESCILDTNHAGNIAYFNFLNTRADVENPSNAWARALKTARARAFRENKNAFLRGIRAALFLNASHLFWLDFDHVVNALHVPHKPYFAEERHASLTPLWQLHARLVVLDFLEIQKLIRLRSGAGPDWQKLINTLKESLPYYDLVAPKNPCDKCRKPDEYCSTCWVAQDGYATYECGMGAKCVFYSPEVDKKGEVVGDNMKRHVCKPESVDDCLNCGMSHAGCANRMRPD